MSGMSSPSPRTLLPPDIEELVIKAHKQVADLVTRKGELQTDIETKTIQNEELTTKIENASRELLRIETASVDKVKELEDREEKVKQKETALDVYASALGEQEKKINKYLAVFDRMKDTIGQ